MTGSAGYPRMVGAENSVLHGDQASEAFLSEIIGAQPFPSRNMSMESLYEYGSRAGLWRVLRARAALTILAWAGRPTRVAALERFLDHVPAHAKVRG
jgi:allantoinase